MSDNDKAVEWLEQLGKLGFVVSIAYGERAGRMLYSVDAMNEHLGTFKRPYGARTFKQAVLIAYKFCIDLGWLQNSEVDGRILKELQTLRMEYL